MKNHEFQSIAPALKSEFNATRIIPCICFIIRDRMSRNRIPLFDFPMYYALVVGKKAPR